MTQTARDSYLETEVLTATPQKLRLMLIEGAIRFARQAFEYWDDLQHPEWRYTALARCHDIVSELYASIRSDESVVTRQVKEIYRFLFTQLTQVSVDKNPQMLRGLIDVLESERETWRQICLQVPEDPRGEHRGAAQCEEITAAGLPAIDPQVAAPLGTNVSLTDRLSLEA